MDIDLIDLLYMYIYMSFSGPMPTTINGHKYILTFTDYFTKFVELFPLVDKCALGVSKGIKSFVCRFVQKTA